MAVTWDVGRDLTGLLVAVPHLVLRIYIYIHRRYHHSKFVVGLSKKKNNNQKPQNNLCFNISSEFFPLGREYSIPSPLQRLLAEMVDFFILFFIKATIIISIMHLSGIK